MSIHRHQDSDSSGDASRRARRELAIVALVSAAIVGALLWRLDLNTVGTAAFADPGWDRHLYREMARRELFDFHLAPYCWRVLVPWLAKIQPWSTQSGFLVVTVGALVGTGPAAYLLVRAAGASRPSGACIVLIFYSLGWAARYSLTDFWVPDATAMFFSCTAAWLIVSKRWRFAALTLAVGVLAKESVIFVAPLAFTWHVRSLGYWPNLRRGLLVVAPAVILIVAVRLLVDAQNGNAGYIASMPPAISRFPELFGEYDYSSRFRDIFVDDRWAHRDWNDFDRYFVDPFGVLLLALAGAGLVATPKRALCVLPVVLLVYLQLLFAADTQRLLVLAFPALALLAGAGIPRVCSWLRVDERAFVAISAVVLLPTLATANDFGAPLLLQIAVIALGVAAFAVGERVILRRRLRQSPPSR